METDSDAEEVDADAQFEQLKQALAEERRRNEDLLNRLKYVQADLENQRKRMDREMKEAGESLARSLLSRLLVVQDELDLAAKHAEEEQHGEETLKEGIEMVSRNLRTALQSVGLERIESVGRPFDPSVHEAVAKVQGKAAGDDMVVEEVRPGYKFRGQLLRPSMVKVELGLKEARQEAKTSE